MTSPMFDLPEHFPIGVNFDGNGPVKETDSLYWGEQCWCGKPGCLEYMFVLEEILFVILPSSRYMDHLRVECKVCGRAGPGPSGSVANVLDWSKQPGNFIPGWMRKCLKGHEWECVCGRAHSSRQSLAAHVVQNRKANNVGHGAMNWIGDDKPWLKKK